MRIYLRIREVKERIDVWLEANEQIHFGPKKSWVGIPVPLNADCVFEELFNINNFNSFNCKLILVELM